ncbi:hypothetical protein AB0D56_35425 [Streptomyces sp. NPDC048209]|uniref:hypothetical protein n=1 Tax=Streptomyces sp. NPDC048209 TaxID=3156689 RepID=UPI0034430E3D
MKKYFHSAITVFALCIAFFATTTGTATAAPIFKGSWAFSASGTPSGSTSGIVNFYNRSAGISGAVRSSFACARVDFQLIFANGAVSAIETRTSCEGEKGFDFTMEGSSPGGPEWVAVNLWTATNNSGPWKHQGRDNVQNNGN